MKPKNLVILTNFSYYINTYIYQIQNIIVLLLNNNFLEDSKNLFGVDLHNWLALTRGVPSLFYLSFCTCASGKAC